MDEEGRWLKNFFFISFPLLSTLGLTVNPNIQWRFLALKRSATVSAARGGAPTHRNVDAGEGNVVNLCTA